MGDINIYTAGVKVNKIIFRTVRLWCSSNETRTFDGATAAATFSVSSGNVPETDVERYPETNVACDFPNRHSPNCCVVSRRISSMVPEVPLKMSAVPAVETSGFIRRGSRLTSQENNFSEICMNSPDSDLDQVSRD